MASAIYRAGDIEAIVEMYAEGAVVRCGCGGVKTITGNEALRAYRIDRLREYPAGTLDDLNPWHEGVIISYDPGAIQARVGSRVGLAGRSRRSRTNASLRARCVPLVSESMSKDDTPPAE